MNDILGAIPLSDDILTKANIGLWAFELDEGEPPRMYVNQAMLGLLGLSRQVSPEETYHAWYDRIDEGSYGLVADTVEKMTAGEHAEVQYPWHHPDGSTMMVRCGGARNFAYTGGVRIEGIHQDVTKLLHFSAEKEIAARETEKRAAANAIAAREAQETLEGFLKKYFAVYRLDLETGKYAALKTYEEYSKRFRKTTGFEQNARLYIDQVVYESDRDMLRHELDLSVIADKIRENNTYSTEYRAYIDGIALWHEMSVSSLGNHEVLLGFAEDDRRILSDHISRLVQGSYDAIYIHDFAAGQIRVLKAAGFMLGKSAVVPYTEILLQFASSLSGDARAYFEAAADPEKEKTRLMSDGRTEYIYLSPNYEDGPSWVKMETRVLTWRDGEPETAVTVSFKADSQQRERLQLIEQIAGQREQLEKSLTVSRYFLDSFVSAYYLDLIEGTCFVMHRTEELEQKYPIEGGYFSSFDRYVENDVHPDDREKMRAIVKPDFIRSHIAKEGTYSEVFRDISGGVEKHYRFLVIPGADENHVGFGFMDITRDVNRDRELISASRSLQLLTDSTRQLYPLIIVLNLSADAYYMLEYDNFTTREAKTEGTVDELIRVGAGTIPNREQSEAFYELFNRQAMAEAFRSGRRVLSLRHQQTGDDGMVHWIHTTSIMSEIDGDLMAVSLARPVDDEVAEERSYQEKLENALARAEVANKAKTDFLFNMSHDIRTPMNAIIGFTDMAIKHIDDTPRVVDSLSKTKEAGALLLSLINDILDMSRIESGKINLTDNEADMNLAFIRIESTMQELARSKNIALSFSFGSIEDRYVYCDFGHCARILVNIITNAIKYTHDGGWVTVRCEQVGAKDGYGIYQFTIADNGIGMSEEFQLHVFDEFSREHNATVSGIQGTGLGLAVCKSFVTAMNGTIECRSKQGEGTVFTVTLPFRLQQEAAYTNPASGEIVYLHDGSGIEDADLNGKRVLLVEDNELNLEIARCMLDEEGMTVETANDGTVAVKLLQDKGPDYYDFILMDIQMPVMNGYEATGAVRRMYPDADIPIIALSANAFAEDKTASLKAGMNDHVAKPINISDLKRAMTMHMKGRHTGLR